MDKKVQTMRNGGKNAKSQFDRPRKSDNVNRGGSGHGMSFIRPDDQTPEFYRDKNATKADMNLHLSLENEDFIMANARFIVKQGLTPRNDSCATWDDIVQINFETIDDVNCLICLGSPVVPRTDVCGHVYCLSCLLKYLSLKSDFQNKCALCAHPLDIQRVKCAGVIRVFAPKTSDVFSMLLMKRHKMGSSPLPVNVFSDQMLHFNAPESRFSKVSMCSNDDLLSMIQIEILALEDELADAFKEEGNDRIDSISKGLDSLRNEFFVTSGLQALEPTRPSFVDLDSFDDFQQVASCHTIFYQAEDGSSVYMCPFNWKCMFHEFLDRGQSPPPRISAPIVDIEKFVVTPDFQNRYRYLQYLPLGSAVTFVELDLTDVVSAKTLDRFSSMLQRRSESRVQKQKVDEMLTSRKIDHENSFNTASKFVYLDSLMKERDPESFTEDDFLPLGHIHNQDTPISNKLTDKHSFAEMLQKGSMTKLMSSVKVTDDDDTPPLSRGFSLGDFVVQAPSSRKK